MTTVAFACLILLMALAVFGIGIVLDHAFRPRTSRRGKATFR